MTSLPEELVIYLAGPMTGIQDHNMPAFEHVTRVLRAQGYTVFPPHEIMHGGLTHENSAYTHADYIREDFKRGLLRCNAVVLLPGWTTSKGALAEMNAASAMGYAIFVFDSAYNRLLRQDVP